MKTEICYHFYNIKTALSKPEYLYFPTVQLQNYSIQDLPPKKTPLWFPPPYCSQSNCWYWFFICLILQTYLLLCNPNFCKHEPELDPQGFILDACTGKYARKKNRKIWSSLKEPLTHLCSCTVMDPWGRHSRQVSVWHCCTAISVGCCNPFGTPQTPHPVSPGMAPFHLSNLEHISEDLFYFMHCFIWKLPRAVWDRWQIQIW